MARKIKSTTETIKTTGATPKSQSADATLLEPKQEKLKQAEIMQQDIQTSSNNSNQTDSVNTAEYGSQYRSRCGGALHMAREKQNLSIADIANRLRISHKQIEAIEADNFAALPEPTIVRGFIRNYAKLLKINAEPLLDAYNVIVPSNSPYEFTVKPTSNMKVGSYKKPNKIRNILAGLLVLLAAGAWLFYQNYIQKPNLTTPIASNTDSNQDNNADVQEPLPEPALPAAERANNAQISTDLTLPNAALPTTNLPDSAAANTAAANVPALPGATTAATVPAMAPPIAAVPPVTAPTVAAPVALNVTPLNTPIANAPIASSATAPAKLEFNANQETWVSIVDATGKEIYNKTIFAGSRESIDVVPPISLVVGNAAGVSVVMNGKQINLAPHTNSNVARVKLNQLN